MKRKPRQRDIAIFIKDLLEFNGLSSRYSAVTEFGQPCFAGVKQALVHLINGTRNAACVTMQHLTKNAGMVRINPRCKRVRP